MPQLKEALNSGSQAVWELKQAFDSRNRERLIDDAIRAAKSRCAPVRLSVFLSGFFLFPFLAE